MRRALRRRKCGGFEVGLRSSGSIPATRVVSESIVSGCIVEQIEGLVIEKAVVLGFCYKVMAGIY